MSNKPKIKKKKANNNCPCCVMTSMFEALENIQEWSDNFTVEAIGQDADYKTSQLNLAFTNAQGSILVLRDLFIEFGQTYLPDRIEQHVH